MQNRTLFYGVTMLVVIVLLGGVVLFYTAREVIARVDDVEITKTMLAEKTRVLQVYRSDSDNPVSETEAFAELLREAKDEALYIRLAGAVNTAEVAALGERIQQETLASATLGRIQTVLGGAESEAYLRTFVRPRYVNTELTKILLRRISGPDADAERMMRAEAIIVRATGGEGLEEISAGDYIVATAYAAEKTPPETFRPLFDDAEYRALQGALASVSDGDVFERPYRLRGSYGVVEVRETSDGTYRLGVLVLPQENITTLYQRLIGELHINIYRLKYRSLL